MFWATFERNISSSANQGIVAPEILTVLMVKYLSPLTSTLCRRFITPSSFTFTVWSGLVGDSAEGAIGWGSGVAGRAGVMLNPELEWCAVTFSSLRPSSEILESGAGLVFAGIAEGAVIRGASPVLNMISDLTVSRDARSSLTQSNRGRSVNTNTLLLAGSRLRRLFAYTGEENKTCSPGLRTVDLICDRNIRSQIYEWECMARTICPYQPWHFSW